MSNHFVEMEMVENACGKSNKTHLVLEKRTRLLLSLPHCYLFFSSFWSFAFDGDGSDNVTGLIIVRVLLLLRLLAVVVVVFLLC